MATINLGSIKFNWQGAYAGGTAYAVDDVVEYNGSSYICILASTGNLPTNATYFEQMSQAGTDGTDVGTTLTTQGDILYRDGSGLQRLGAGTSGQALITNGTGANPSWGDVGGGVLQVKQSLDGNTYDIATVSQQGATAGFAISGLTTTITPTSSSSKLLLQLSIHGTGDSAYMQYVNVTWQPSGGTEQAITSSNDRGVTLRFDEARSTADMLTSSSATLMLSPATTNEITIRVRGAKANSSSANLYINRTPNNATDTDDGGYTLSSMTVTELEGSISSHTYTGATASKT